MQRTTILASAAIGLLGAALGFAVGRALLRERPLPEVRPHLAARSAPDESAPIGAAAAASRTEPPNSKDAARREAVREDEAPWLEELARLRARVAELEAEVARLRALQADRDPACRNLRQLFAANDLKHGALYREIAELVVDDPESVTDDPRRLTRLFLRCVDETGLGAAAPDENGIRTIEPEPNAPEISFKLAHSSSDAWTTDASGVHVLIRSEDVEFRGVIRLPKSAEGWLGPPFDIKLALTIERNSNRTGWCQLLVHDERSPKLVQVEWSACWSAQESSLSRSPWKGGQESLIGDPRDFAEQHRVVDELFAQFRSRAP